MTLEELSSLYYINKEIEKLKEELYNLNNNRNFYKSNIISDMPRGGEPKDIMLNYAENKKTIEDMLNYSLRKLQIKRAKIEEFLSQVEDAETRLIMRLRCINNMRWEDIGEELGMSRTTVSRKFYNYFQVAHNAH